MSGKEISDPNGQEDMPPPRYREKKMLNGFCRPATHEDAAAIALIHKFWCEKTTAPRSRLEEPMTSKKIKSEIDLTADFKMPFSVTVDRDKDAIVGFAYALPRYEHYPTSHYHLSIAQLYVYVHPDFLERGVGRALVNNTIRTLRECRYVLQKDRGKGTIAEQRKNGLPYWKSLIVVMPVRGSRFDMRGQRLPEEGQHCGPMTEKAQHQLWTSMGFEEAGRLYYGIEHDTITRDEWIWQFRL